MSNLQKALQGVNAPSISMRELQQQQFRGGSIQQAPTKTTNYAGQLTALAQGGAQVVGAYVDMREKEGQKRKNDLMLKHMERSEIGKLRQSGTLLYQDDPYAMRALDRELGRGDAYSVDAQTMANIESGLWNTRAKVEEGRAYLMKESQKNMAETYGVDPANNHYFLEGYTSDQTDRDFAIYNAVDKKEAAEKTNLGFTAASSNLSDMASAGVPMSEAIVYLNENGRNGSGLIPNDEAKEKLIMQYARDLANSPNGQKLLDEALDVPLDLYGRSDVTLRQRLGAEGVNSLKLTAAENLFKLDKERAKWFTGATSFISNIDGSNPDAVTAVRDKYAEVSQWLDSQEQTAQVTSARQQLEQAMAQAELRVREGNNKREAALIKGRQQEERISEINFRAERRMAGHTDPIGLDSFTESASSGQYNTNDYNLAFDAYRAKIADLPEDEQIIKLLQYGNVFPEGTSGVAAWKASSMEAYNKEGLKINAAVTGGLDMPDTPRRDAMLAAYQKDPETFIANFPEYVGETLEMAVVQDLGLDYKVFYSGKQQYDKLDETAKQVHRAELAAVLTKDAKNKFFAQLPPSEQDIYIKATMGLSGLDRGQAMNVVDKALGERYQSIGAGGSRGFVEKKLLQLDPADTSSVSKGRAALEAYSASAFGDSAAFMAISSDSRGNIRLNHPVLGERILTKEGLREWAKNNNRL